MVAITVSMDEKTYRYVVWYMEKKETDNLSQAIRMLVQKGIAHEKAVEAQLADGASEIIKKERR